MLSFFDWLVEEITTLFVFGHVSGRLAMKAVVRAFSFVRLLPSIHGIWLGKVLIVTMGTTLPMHVLLTSLTNQRIHQCCCLRLSGTNTSPCDRSNLEEYNQIGRTSIEQIWARALPVVISVYSLGATKWSRGQICQKEGEGGLCMRRGSYSSNDPEWSSLGRAFDMSIKFREPCFQISLVNIPCYSKCSLRICGFQLT
jgi:hypothetical protein